MFAIKSYRANRSAQILRTSASPQAVILIGRRIERHQRIKVARADRFLRSIEGADESP